MEELLSAVTTIFVGAVGGCESTGAGVGVGVGELRSSGDIEQPTVKITSASSAIMGARMTSTSLARLRNSVR